MPTLFRFLTVVIVLAGLAGAGMVYLAYFVNPKARELTVRIPAEKLVPQHIAPPPSAEPPSAAAEGTATEAPEAAGAIEPPKQPE
jgi:hypothetical protein